MSQPDAPKIEFPCTDYPIKIVGVTIEGYDEIMIEIVSAHAEISDNDRTRVNESSNGRFCSLTIYITATGPDQLSNIHRDLSAHPTVRMVM